MDGSSAFGGSSLPVRRTLHYLQWMGNCKSLLLFLTAYFLFAHINSRRMDWGTGHTTLQWLSEAHELVGLQPFDKLDTLDNVAKMLQDGVPQVVTALDDTCRSCAVGLTSFKEDLRFIGLESFVCSDFDSQANSEDYPPRRCAIADAAWAAAPSSDSAPCCKNSTLLKASIAMMSEHERTGVTKQPLLELLHKKGGSTSATQHYIETHVTSDQFLLQLVVSRDEHMAAVEYYADWVDRKDAPNRLTTYATYWSVNYAIPVELNLARVCLLLALAFTFAHDVRMRRADAHKQSMRARGSLSDEDDVGDLRLRTPFYVYCVEVPSIVGPVVLEVIRYQLPLPTWQFYVTLVEMLLSVRLFVDAANVVPPMRRLVLVFKEAAPNLLAYVVSLVPLAVLTAVMHSQAFGLFDTGFSDVVTGITRVVRYLTAPPGAETVEPEAFVAVGQSTTLLYFWSTIVFRLAFGSFIVAILVGSFNKVVALELEHEAKLKREMSLPSGYVNREADGLRGALLHAYWFASNLVTRHAYGMIMVDLIKQLNSEVHAREMRDWRGDLMPTEAQLRQLFRAFDADASGTINLEELQAALLKAGKKVSMDKCVEILHQVDTNSDGLISFDEFIKIFERAPMLFGVGLLSAVGWQSSAGSSAPDNATIMIDRDDLEQLIGERAATQLLRGFGADPPSAPTVRDDGLLGGLMSNWYDAATSLVSASQSSSKAPFDHLV